MELWRRYKDVVQAISVKLSSDPDFQKDLQQEGLLLLLGLDLSRVKGNHNAYIRTALRNRMISVARTDHHKRTGGTIGRGKERSYATKFNPKPLGEPAVESDDARLAVRIDLLRYLSKLDQADQELLVLWSGLGPPFDWEGMWPPNIPQIAKYIGDKFACGLPISEGMIRFYVRRLLGGSTRKPPRLGWAWGWQDARARVKPRPWGTLEDVDCFIKPVPDDYDKNPDRVWAVRLCATPSSSAALRRRVFYAEQHPRRKAKRNRA